jgi:hypothetical protein
MAAVVTVTDSWDTGGNRTEYIGTIAMDNSYPTGGEPIDVANNERFAWLHAAGGGTTASGAGYVFQFDAPNQKLVVLWGNAGSASVLPEFTSTGDLSALTAIPFRALSD